MPTAPYQGHAKSLGAYVRAGGAEENYFAQGYAHSGRFGMSDDARDPAWSSEQRSAYNKGVLARLDDNVAERAGA